VSSAALAHRHLALAVAVALAAASAMAQVPLPDGYRTEDYRAPTPDTVPGAQTLDTPAAAALWRRGGAIWIDVLSAPRRPVELPPTALWRPSPRFGIPGSLWLPEAGRGVLAPVLETWFRDSLAQATAGDPDRPVVFYCLAECWMSWNAARRTAAWGYRAVYWYRDGTDGWEAAGLPTEVLHPAPGAP
jgi:PQQ-dependent catabolism-associated CXXCW motif protein